MHLSRMCKLRGRGQGGWWLRRSASSIAYAEGGHVRDRGCVVNFAKYLPKSSYTRLHWPLHLALSNCQPMGITIAVVHHRPRAWHARDMERDGHVVCSVAIQDVRQLAAVDDNFCRLLISVEISQYKSFEKLKKEDLSPRIWKYK